MAARRTSGPLLLLALVLSGCGHSLDLVVPPRRSIPTVYDAGRASAVSEQDVVDLLAGSGAFAGLRAVSKAPGSTQGLGAMIDKAAYPPSTRLEPGEVLIDVQVTFRDDQDHGMVLPHAFLTVFTGFLGGFISLPYGGLEADFELRCTTSEGALISRQSTRARVEVWHQYFGVFYFEEALRMLREAGVRDLVARLLEDPALLAHLRQGDRGGPSLRERPRAEASETADVFPVTPKEPDVPPATPNGPLAGPAAPPSPPSPVPATAPAPRCDYCGQAVSRGARECSACGYSW